MPAIGTGYQRMHKARVTYSSSGVGDAGFCYLSG